MNTTTNRAPLSKAALLAKAFAVTSGLGGILQASTAFVVPTVVVTPARSPHAELRQLVADIQPSAAALAQALEDTYLAMSRGNVDRVGEADYAELDAMAQTLREHEAQLDRIMEGSGLARGILMPLRRTIAKARSNASIVASLARQHSGEYEHFAGRADSQGLKALAQVNTDIVLDRLG